MSRRFRLGRRDGVAMIVVVCGHVLLVFLFARAREQERLATESMPRSTPRLTLFIVELPETPPRQIETTPAVSLPTVSIEPPAVPRMPSDAAPVVPATPDRSIDWRGEAQQSVRSALEGQSAPQPRGFEEKAPEARAPKPRQFNWDPSPGRFGFAGGLPYMELGKRCVIALGFFACAIGELPPADGTLFDGMKDADRERSSVPAPRE